MAPQTSDPSHLRVLLNPARRKALLTLIMEITAYMRQQLVLQPTSSHSRQQPSSRQGDAPLFHQPPSRSSTSSSSQDTPSSPPANNTQSYSSQLLRIRQAALVHFDAWRSDLLTKLKAILSAADDAKIMEARRARQEKLATSPGLGENLINFGTAHHSAEDEEANSRAEAVEQLQALYHAIPTRLTTIPAQDRLELLSAFLLLLLSTGIYTPDSRTLAVYLCSALSLPLSDLVAEELEIAVGLVEGADKARKDGSMSADAEAAKRKEENKVSRYWKVGLASVAGAAVIGVTGGLAAPVVAGAIGGLMGSVGLGGVASFLGIFWMNGVLVGTLFGGMGARMTVSFSHGALERDMSSAS